MTTFSFLAVQDATSEQTFAYHLHSCAPHLKRTKKKILKQSRWGGGGWFFGGWGFFSLLLERVCVIQSKNDTVSVLLCHGIMKTWVLCREKK